MADHDKDSDCAGMIDAETNCCTSCGVYHGEPCVDCGGKGFHKDECPQMVQVRNPIDDFITFIDGMMERMETRRAQEELETKRLLATLKDAQISTEHTMANVRRARMLVEN